MCAYQRKGVAQVDNNALAKAAEVIEEWLSSQFCHPCVRGKTVPEACQDCPVRRAQVCDTPNLARAVLEAAEAAGVQQSGRTCAICNWWERESQEYDPKTGPGLWWGLCHVTSERVEVDGDLDCWAELRTREDFGCVCWAGLQRPGKSDALTPEEQPVIVTIRGGEEAEA